MNKPASFDRPGLKEKVLELARRGLSPFDVAILDTKKGFLGVHCNLWQAGDIVAGTDGKFYIYLGWAIEPYHLGEFDISPDQARHVVGEQCFGICTDDLSVASMRPDIRWNPNVINDYRAIDNLGAVHTKWCDPRISIKKWQELALAIGQRLDPRSPYVGHYHKPDVRESVLESAEISRERARLIWELNHLMMQDSGTGSNRWYKALDAFHGGVSVDVSNPYFAECLQAVRDAIALFEDKSVVVTAEVIREQFLLGE